MRWSLKKQHFFRVILINSVHLYESDVKYRKLITINFQNDFFRFIIKISILFVGSILAKFWRISSNFRLALTIRSTWFYLYRIYFDFYRIYFDFLFYESQNVEVQRSQVRVRRSRWLSYIGPLWPIHRCIGTTTPVMSILLIYLTIYSIYQLHFVW